MLADERKCSILVKLYFPELKNRYKEFYKGFSPILRTMLALMERPGNMELQQKYLAEVSSSREACYDFLDYLEANSLSLTGNFLGR